MIWALLLACARPPLPAAEAPGWSVDRDALPETRLRVMYVATMDMKESDAMFHQGRGKRQAPVFSYLVEHPTQGLVLIDAGLGRRSQADPTDYPGYPILRLVPGFEVHGPVADQLPEIGVQAEQVAHIVNTHLHYDHAGGLEDFPSALLHVPAVEWEAATADPQRGLSWPYFERQALDLFEWEEHTPYAGFRRHRDLFGDGSIILLDAPGHSAGHTMVLLNQPAASFLFTGDAAWVDENWQLPVSKGRLARAVFDEDWKAGMGTQMRIKAFAEAHPEVTIVAGHEERNLQRLRLFPESYP